MEDSMKAAHIAAFDFANEVAVAVDATHGEDFKTAFVAALLVHAHRNALQAHPVLTKEAKPKRSGKAKPKAAKAGRKPAPVARKVGALLNIADGRYTTAGAADFLGITPKRFENLRTHRRVPRGTAHGNRFVYTRDELLAIQRARKAA